MLHFTYFLTDKRLNLSVARSMIILGIQMGQQLLKGFLLNHTIALLCRFLPGDALYWCSMGARLVALQSPCYEVRTDPWPELDLPVTYVSKDVDLV